MTDAELSSRSERSVRRATDIASSTVPSDEGDSRASEQTAAAAINGSPGAELPRVLTPEELASILRLRKRSVYEAINRGDIPGVRRIGRKIRIDRDCVLAWMAEGHGRAPRSSRR